MPNEFLQYDITHLIGICIAIISLTLAGLTIRKYSKEHKQFEIFWAAWWLVITLVVGGKFI